MKVAYSGVPGAFAHIAAKNVFPDGVPLPYGSFREAYEAVESGKCDCAVLPIENSFAGDVAQVIDLMFFGSLLVTGIYDLEIGQNLLGNPSSSVKTVREVVSHPQALDQCAPYIEKHGFVPVEAPNTAVAAKQVAESGRTDIAAIASSETARLYGLNIIDAGINQSSANTTRFAVFSRAGGRSSESDNHFIMFFTVKNEAGSLTAA
jgi:chorismate mutase/prephenate dehydratase